MESSEQSREPATNQIDTSEAVANILCEFLEGAFHHILCIRGIYSPLLFERARKYNTTVQVCRHPELNQYIKQVLHGLSPLIEKNELQKVLLTVIDKDRQTVEAFNFCIQNIGPGHQSDSLGGNNFLMELESQFRSFLLKISECVNTLQPLPSECSFMILAVTRLSAATSMEYTHAGQEFPWVIMDKQESSINDSKATPLKSVSTEILKVSRHPELNQYIKQVLHGLSPLIEKNELQKVLLTVIDKDRQTVEAFNFCIQNIGLGHQSDSLGGNNFLMELESQFRSFLLKIKCSFMILAVTRLPAATAMEYAHAGQEFPWVITDKQESSINNSKAMPLKSVSTEILKMQLYLETS